MHSIRFLRDVRYKNLVFFLAYSLITFFVSAQQLPELIPFRKGNTWGFSDQKRIIKIPCKYDDVEPFYKSSGLAKVSIQDKWGLVDTLGREVVAPIYDRIEFRSENVIELRLNNKVGIANQKGIVIPPQYDGLSPMYGLMDGFAICKVNNKYGYVNEHGEIVSPKYDRAFLFSEGLAHVALGGKHGFIDKSGREIIPLQYEDADDFTEGLARVKRNGKWGFIDPFGNEVVRIEFDLVFNFKNGFARVRDKWKWGFVNKRGEEVVFPKYQDVEDFSEQRASVKANGKWGFIDTEGNEVVPPRYDTVSSFSEGLAIVRKNHRDGVIDFRGKEVVPPTYENISSFHGGVGIIDKTGKEIVPPRYDGIGTFFENRVFFLRNNKVGFLDKEGKEVIPAKYDYLAETNIRFENGLAYVALKGRGGYIDLQGNEYWED